VRGFVGLFASGLFTGSALFTGACSCSSPPFLPFTSSGVFGVEVVSARKADAEGRSDAGVPDAGGWLVGFPLVLEVPGAGWLGGEVAFGVEAAWSPELRTHSICRVMTTGRLLVDTSTAVQGDGSLRHVLVSPTEQIPIGPEGSNFQFYTDYEAVGWCEDTTDGFRCLRVFADGGISLAPEAVFSIESWTKSGFISGGLRLAGGASQRVLFIPDAGLTEGPTSLRFKESGIGAGQLRPGSGLPPIAVVYRAGQLYRLERNPVESAWGADVNDQGLVVGQKFIEGANSAAVFWGGQSAVLAKKYGYSADLRAVNQAGLAVGQERNGERGWGLVWYRGKTAYLDELVDAGVGCYFDNAESVNDQHQIAVQRRCMRPQGLWASCVRIDLNIDGGFP